MNDRKTWIINVILLLVLAGGISIAFIRGGRKPEGVPQATALEIIWTYNAPLRGKVRNLTGRDIKDCEIEIDYRPAMRDRNGFQVNATLTSVGNVPTNTDYSLEANALIDFIPYRDNRSSAEIAIEDVVAIRAHGVIDGVSVPLVVSTIEDSH